MTPHLKKTHQTVKIDGLLDYLSWIFGNLVLEMHDYDHVLDMRNHVWGYDLDHTFSGPNQ